jgi:hypothetical protein
MEELGKTADADKNDKFERLQHHSDGVESDGLLSECEANRLQLFVPSADQIPGCRVLIENQ